MKEIEKEIEMEILNEYKELMIELKKKTFDNYDNNYEIYKINNNQDTNWDYIVWVINWMKLIVEMIYWKYISQQILNKILFPNNK